VPKKKGRTGTKESAKKTIKKPSKKAVKKTITKPSTKKTTKVSKKVSEIDEIELDEEEEMEVPDEERVMMLEIEIEHGYIAIPKIWPDHLTKYERSRIIGARALQISMGAPILVEELEKLGNPVEVAEHELAYGILPLTIRRIFPDGEFIDVPVQDLLESE